MPALTTACPLDCPDACSLEVVVEDGRIVRVDGTSTNPVTAGYICSKVRTGLAEHVHGDSRVRHPLLRRGRRGSGEFDRIGWDQALDLAASKMLEARDRFGGESIVPLSYGGSNGFLTQDNADARLFRRLGASNLARTVCAVPTSLAATGLYGKMGGVAYTDYPEARLIIVWGMNPGASGIHLTPYLKRARENGAKLVVVDPRRIKTATMADIHLAVRPGADLPVALSMIRWLFESGAADEGFLAAHATGVDELRRRASDWSFARAAEAAGVEASEIESVARLYAESSPAVIRTGWGMERNRNGGSAVAAVLALPAVAGKLCVRGGGYTMSNSGVYGIDGEPAIAAGAPSTRTINMNQLGRDLLNRNDPPIKILFVYNNNGLATLPNQEIVRQGLMREDLFSVVFDQVMTDTARLADLVLPATTFLEHHELLRGYGAYGLQMARPVIDPVGEARPNHQVFEDLCRRTAVHKEGDPEGTESLMDTLLKRHPMGDDGRRSLERGALVPPPSGASPVQMVDVKPRTSDGKIHLVPGELDAQAPGGLYAWREDPAAEDLPLALISPNTSRTISSTFGQLHREQVPLEIHRDDAAARGITNGDKVRVRNTYGEVHCLARLSESIRPGVVSLPKGLWSHNTLNGRTANALAPDTLTDIGGGACFNDARVQVERLTA